MTKKADGRVDLFENEIVSDRLGAALSRLYFVNALRRVLKTLTSASAPATAARALA